MKNFLLLCALFAAIGSLSSCASDTPRTTTTTTTEETTVRPVGQ